LDKAPVQPDYESLCAYCGEVGPTTRDHVVPRCLFVHPFPKNLVTVPACQVCNGGKGGDDTFLRDYLTSDIVGYDHPTAGTLFGGKVTRAVRHNRSELARLVRQGPARRLALRSPAGLHLGEAIEVPLPDGRIASILFKMVRGLYFDSRKTRLVDEIPYEVLRHPPDAWTRFATAFKDKAAKVLGDVFECAYMYGTEDPSITLWVMRFYRRIPFTIETGALVGEDLCS
jgi:hypothetical protein